MGLHLRAEWATRNPAFSPARKGVGTVVVHHTAGSASLANKAQTLRGLEDMVTRKAPGNSSPLIALDYSVLVFADGDVWAGRGFQFEDAATLRFNAQSVSVCAVGNYDIDQPPPALLNGIAYATQLAIAGGWVVPHPSIVGHRDVGTFATACPGRYLEAQLPTIRRLVGGVTVTDPAPVPAEEAIDMTEFYCRDPKGKLGKGKGAEFYVVANTYSHVDQTQKDLLKLAAVKSGEEEIVNLGDLSDAQLTSLARFAFVGKP